MSPQRRTALASVAAAAVLLSLKLVTGLASGSLGLVAEAVHSGTDLVAALLTFFAVGYAARPADRGHPYGHGKAEHLAALLEAAVLVVLSLGVCGLAVARLSGRLEAEVEATWWAFAAVAVVLVVDLSRMLASLRTARRYGSAALQANALHFGGDLAGTLAVLAGLAAVAAGWPGGDSIAALVVALLVVVAAGRLIRVNVDVLMDRASTDSVSLARRAVASVEPPVELRRLRLREAGGRAFADVVIAVPPDDVVGQGHAAADRVEEALEQALPGCDVVVHVEPGSGDAALQERVRAAASSVPRVREVHNLSVIDLGEEGLDVTLHVKLPGSASLEDAHRVADQVEQAIVREVPEVGGVLTHLEPLAEESAGRVAGGGSDEIDRIARDVTGRPPVRTRVLHTDEGLVVLLVLAVDGDATLAGAHTAAALAEERVREAVPGVAEVIVHTEPAR